MPIPYQNNIKLISNLYGVDTGWLIRSSCYIIFLILYAIVIRLCYLVLFFINFLNCQTSACYLISLHLISLAQCVKGIFNCLFIIFNVKDAFNDFHPDMLFVSSIFTLQHIVIDMFLWLICCYFYEIYFMIISKSIFTMNYISFIYT